MIRSDKWPYHWYSIGQRSKNCISEDQLYTGDQTKYSHWWYKIMIKTAIFETKPEDDTPMTSNDRMIRTSLNASHKYDGFFLQTREKQEWMSAMVIGIFQGKYREKKGVASVKFNEHTTK